MGIPFVESFFRKRSRVVQAVAKVLLSTGLISTLLMLKGAFLMPYPCDLVFSSLLGFWNSVKCFLSSPLYICIIINFIVLLIKFSSTFHHRVPSNRDHVTNIQTKILPPPTSQPPPPPPSPPPPPVPHVGKASPKEISTKIVTIKELHKTSRDDSPDILHGNIKQYGIGKPNEEHMPQALEIKKTKSQLTPKPNLQESTNVKMETKTYPSKRGKEISVGKEDKATNDDEEGDSMEATWKAIMGGGKQRPKKRPLKKSETWDVPTKPSNVPMKRLDSEEVVPSSPIWREMRKAESFNDAMSITRRGGLIRRGSSMSLEDFNNKVEGFIKKLKWKAKASGSKNARML